MSEYTGKIQSYDSKLNYYINEDGEIMITGNNDYILNVNYHSDSAEMTISFFDKFGNELYSDTIDGVNVINFPNCRTIIFSNSPNDGLNPLNYIDSFGNYSDSNGGFAYFSMNKSGILLITIVGCTVLVSVEGEL